jgi:hypothetical protein
MFSLVGLGCRSLSYFVYASLSTLVCFLMILSSTLSYCHKAEKERWSGVSHPQRLNVYKSAAIYLRYAGNILAVISTMVVLAAGIFQFGNVFNNCFCDSSVLGLGASAFNVVIPTDVGVTRSIWAGAIVIAVGGVGIFLTFVWLRIDDGPEVLNRQATHTCIACHGTGTLLPHDEDRSRVVSRAASPSRYHRPEVDDSPEIGFIPPLSQTESIRLFTLIPPHSPSLTRSMTDTCVGSDPSNLMPC